MAIAAVWSEVLARDTVGRDQNFFTLGGDSLLAAKLAGRLLERIPQIEGRYFDELLREVLDHPTVAGLADRFTGASGAQEDSAPRWEAHWWNEECDGMPLVLLHDGAGGPEEVHAEVAAGVGRPVLALVPAGLPTAEPDGLLEWAADACVQRLLDEGVWEADLRGHGVGGLLAVAVGSQLTEAGGEVGTLTVLGSCPPDGAVPGQAPDRDALLKAAEGYRPPLYPGDLTFLYPPGTPAVAADTWRPLCLGDVRVVEEPAPGEGPA
nr:phosphopantetheine-binding protein [Streptomyces sp. SID8354]